MQNTKKDQSFLKNSRGKSEQKTKAKIISARKKQPEALEELARTWDEDLCE